MDEDLIRVVHPNGFVNIDWGLTLPEGAEGVNCTEGNYCLDSKSPRVVVTQEEHCHKVSWVASNLTELKDCVIIDGHWYGGGEQDAHSWPLENVPHFETPFAIGHGWLQCLAEAYWVSSQGAAIRVEEGTPLFVSLPDHNLDLVADRLCLSAKHKAPFSSQEGDSLKLTYYVCTGNDVKEVHTRSYSKFFKNPSGMPDLRMFQDPVWSTWAEYHKDINETKVREFAANIKRNGFSYSQIEIDDNWETCYGDLTFDPAKFLTPRKWWTTFTTTTSGSLFGRTLSSTTTANLFVSLMRRDT
ncbi:myogenesis-regulating glycosidase-like [Macrobrachium nipponense]|uniref:myogenesis-regulating glycosidase-like n=1 Tax=Macrobrachium nipponense TaxID=159736 RepID=UPI0030C82B62